MVSNRYFHAKCNKCQYKYIFQLKPKRKKIGIQMIVKSVGEIKDQGRAKWLLKLIGEKRLV